MNLTPIKANMTELDLPGGLKVLFSYKTPVAVRWTNGINATYYKTDKFWSKTTSRHINQWFVMTDGWENREVITKPQEYFDKLLSEVSQ